MRRSVALYCLVGVGLGWVGVRPGLPAARESAPPETSRIAPPPVRQAAARVPVAFEMNRGQTAVSCDFVARCGNYRAFLSSTAVQLDLGGEASLRMSFAGARSTAASTGAPLRGEVSYLLGDDPAGWITGIPRVDRVAYSGVYPGIDLVYRLSGRNVRFDLELAPGAAVNDIEIAFDGSSPVCVDALGELTVALPTGEVRLSPPRAYQRSAGSTQPVDARFAVRRNGSVAFELGSFDPDLPLVIDPDLGYSTYLGGSEDDEAAGADVDSDGNVYVAGHSRSLDLPVTTGAYQTSRAGSSLNQDVMAAKLDSSGTQLEYLTYIGGAGNDRATCIEVDGQGNAFVGGETTSSDYPTVSAAEATRTQGADMGFVSKLNASGSALSYSTYLSDGFVVGLGVDGSGQAHAAADGPFVSVVKLASNGASKLYTYDGGVRDATLEMPTGIALDGSGNAYVVGWTLEAGFPTTTGAYQETRAGSLDGFVVKLTSTGSVSYSTFLGGGESDRLLDVAVDSQGRATVVGVTRSTDYPLKDAQQATNHGEEDCVISRLDAAGSALEFSTYLGGDGNDDATDVVLFQGRTYVAGVTLSSDFPTERAEQDEIAGANDLFVTVLSLSDTRLYSSFLGGAGGEGIGGLAVNETEVVIVGLSLSDDYPVVAAIQDARIDQRDAIITGVTGLTLPIVTTELLPDWTRDRPYAAVLAAERGTPPYTWVHASGDLPEGGSISPSGTLSGPFTESGQFAFEVRVTDVLGGVATKDLMLTVNELPAIATTEFPDCSENHEVAYQLESAGGTAPFTWSLVGGALHTTGFDGIAGEIDGRTVAPGDYSFTLRLTDAASAVAEREYDVTLHPFPAIATEELPFAALGRAYHARVAGSGGAPPVTWDVVAGRFVAGLELAADTGQIDGAPTLAGAFHFTSQRMSACGAVVEKDLSIHVADVLDLAKKRSTVQLLGGVATPGVPELVALELLAGTRLSVLAKFKKDAEGAPFELAIQDGSGVALDLEGLLKSGKKSVKTKPVTIPKTNRYFVVLTPIRAFQSEVKLSVKVTPPKKLGGQVHLDGAQAATVMLSALPGARMTITAKSAKGSAAIPTITSVRDESGAELLLATELKEKKRSTTLKVKTPLDGGDLRVTLDLRDGSAGSVDWKASLKLPTGYVFDLADLPAGDPK